MYQIVGDAFCWALAISCLPALATLGLGGVRWATTFLVVTILFSATLVTEGVVLSALFVVSFFPIKRWGGMPAFRNYVACLSALRRIGAYKFEYDRLAAFSDGVIAIIITIMVLEFKAPHDSHWSALWALAPIFSSYALSFLYVAIYWSNHHHLLQTVTRVNGTILWANVHLLFWLSLVPFTTAWMGETKFSTEPVAAYGVSLLALAIAYFLLTKAIIAAQGENSTIRTAGGVGVKVIQLILLYTAGIALAFISSYAALAAYVLGAILLLVPD